MSKGLSYKYSGTSGHVRNTIKLLPKSPKRLLSAGWRDISHPAEARNGIIKLKEERTGLKIRYDKGKKARTVLEKLTITTYITLAQLTKMIYT